MKLIERIRIAASSLRRRVVFPEAAKDIRIIEAAIFLHQKQLVSPVLLGSEDEIQKLCSENDVSIPKGLTIFPVNGKSDFEERYQFFSQKLAHKKPDQETLQTLCGNALFTAGWLLEKGDVDGAVAGSVASTPEVIIAALRTVGVSDDSGLVSSCFLMEMPDHRVFTYGDCAVVPYPDSIQLADIALDSAKTHLKLTGIEPKIAFLSFSTKGSARHESVTKIQEAYSKAKEKSNWVMDGELQFDAAVIPEISTRKAPDSSLKGDANVLIFPNLDAGNIGYKITERLAGAVATGPILQGLSKPYLDLSRGCSVDDIINTACVAALLS
ncbi:MAG: phosphotransacetylase [Balneolaceae bacterium]|nr:MAG: phosphotransacetylase [Balneolaceae bacterium]